MKEVLSTKVAFILKPFSLVQNLSSLAVSSRVRMCATGIRFETTVDFESAIIWLFLIAPPILLDDSFQMESQSSLLVSNLLLRWFIKEFEGACSYCCWFYCLDWFLVQLTIPVDLLVAEILHENHPLPLAWLLSNCLHSNGWYLQETLSIH